MRTIAASLVLLGFACLPQLARADWPDSGLVVLDPLPSNGAMSVYVKRAPNGDVVPLVAARGVSMGYVAQRVLPTGVLAPGWGVAGVFLTNAASSELYHTHALVPDDVGGVFHAGFFDPPNPDSVGLQYVQPGGAVLPYSFGHWRIASGNSSSTTVDGALDGAGGAYVAWTLSSVRLQRRRADGTVEPGWSPFGRVVASAGSFPVVDVESDGAGGAIVLWTNTDGPPHAMRFLSDTTAAPGWSAGGLVLGANAPAGGYSSAEMPKLVPSGPDHWIAVWLEPYQTPNRIVAQRFGRDGTLDPAWPAAGLVVSGPSDGITATTAMSDGLDGLHVLSLQGGWPNWVHVLASGAFAPGHSVAGVAPQDPGAQLDSPSTSYLVAAPALDGGLIYLSNDMAGPSIRAHWLLADGSPDPSEPNARSIPIPTTNGLKAAISDGAGGVYVLWQKTYDSFTRKLFMGWLQHATPVAVAPSAGPAGALALSVPNPNPSRAGFDVRFTLPDGVPARLELFDLSGRLLRAREVRGAGAGTARFERMGELRAGVYVVRLSHGSETRTARVTVLP